MAAILLTPPAAEPLTLAEAKAYLRVEHADDDALIATLVAGARGHVEARTRRALIAQTWRVVLDAWPRAGRIALPFAPVRAVVAARTFDQDNAAHAIDPQAFVVDAASAPGLLGFALGSLAPPGRALAGVELDVEFGYGTAASAVPEPLRHAVRILLAHWYEHRGAVLVDQGAQAAPLGFDALIAPYRGLTL